VRFVPTRPGTPVAGALVAEKVVDVTPATTYVVKPGDNLWTIARKHKLTVADLTAANGVAANTSLQPGRKLVIPAKSAPIPPGTASAGGEAPAKAAAPVAATPAKAPGETVRHMVRTGETLGTIARAYGVRQADIAVANRIADPAKIQAGTELVIPGGKAAAARNGKSAKGAGKAEGAAGKSPAKTETAPATPAAEAAAAPPAPPVVPIIRIDDSPITPAPKP
jgi:LysM repeat protein